MGLVDLLNNMQRAMGSSRPTHSSSSAWKSSLLFWRRLLKKSPSKTHVIKPSTNPSSPQRLPKRAKLVTSKQEYTHTNTNHFYYSYPDHNIDDDDEVSGNMLGCYQFGITKARSRPCSGYATPTNCDYSSGHLCNKDNYNDVPYFQLRRAHTLSPAVLPLYIVS